MSTEIGSEKFQQGIKVLRELVIWWDMWNASENPYLLDDPPIEEARAVLKSLNREDVLI